VSFLEYFEYRQGLTDNEFEDLMPPELYRGYQEMMAYMEKIAKDENEGSKET
jgi:type III secretion system FlhB-like substrate exporter